MVASKDAAPIDASEEDLDQHQLVLKKTISMPAPKSKALN
jgi:hypothetical protein